MHIFYQSKTHDFLVRETQRSDLKTIHQFIIKLATYEHMAHLVTATINDLEQTLFDKPFAKILLAVEQGSPVGFALYFYNYSTFLGKPNLYLEDLYIEAQHRNKGYGKIMLSVLAKIAIESNCDRLDWQCLDWNDPSIKFYESIGAKSLNHWLTFRLEKDALKSLSKSI